MYKNILIRKTGDYSNSIWFAMSELFKDQLFLTLGIYEPHSNYPFSTEESVLVDEAYRMLNDNAKRFSYYLFDPYDDLAEPEALFTLVPIRYDTNSRDYTLTCYISEPVLKMHCDQIGSLDDCIQKKIKVVKGICKKALGEDVKTVFGYEVSGSLGCFFRETVLDIRQYIVSILQDNKEYGRRVEEIDVRTRNIGDNFKTILLYNGHNNIKELGYIKTVYKGCVV